MKRSLLALTLLAVACGGSTEAQIPGEETTDPTPPGTSGKGTGPIDPTEPDEDDGFPVDLRADTNRDGEIRFDDPADDANEETWDEKHGAVFLANIDDDEERCPTSNVSDIDLPKCHDAADEIVNGEDDALDLARLKTRPWPEAPADARGEISFTAAEHVRLFKVSGDSFSVIESGASLRASELQDGVELAIEGRDIVRDLQKWDGYVDVTFTVRKDGKTKSDKVRMRVSPVMTYHHLLAAEQTWVSSFNSAGNAAMRADLVTAAAAAGVPAPTQIATTDPWTQDFFETGFMSMPGPKGSQHVIRVNLRSANQSNPLSLSNPLRRAGRVVFTGLRGKDSAGIQEFDASSRGRFDTLNSFGNFETIPPYTHGGKSYPLGRILRGSTPTYYPDRHFTRMMDAQAIQPALNVDTSWLLVAHVDETLSFIKAKTPRGWVLLANDPTMARTMLEQASAQGYGNVPMFTGKWWDARTPAQVTINQVLSNPNVMGDSALAAIEVADQVSVIKKETGLTDAEIVRIPFLHERQGGRSVAYQPGLVNGLYIAPGHFVAPDPHGPVINGQDIFKVAMQQALAPYDVTVHFAEDWDTYHRALGEVHCGTNATREVPSAKWWESGR
jgi:protein-arginine deiminase